ncbi:MAG: hypothetical protein NTU60_06505 [Candidatus Aminicenantes bacterium]|nr:hypothetical protein [Candidatus Aminicenantes bacterium]
MVARREEDDQNDGQDRDVGGHGRFGYFSGFPARVKGLSVWAASKLSAFD